MQVLHLAAATGAFMQTKVRARRLHPLGRLDVDLGQSALFETGLAAVHLSTHHFKGERPFNKHHFAVRSVGDPLGFEV